MIWQLRRGHLRGKFLLKENVFFLLFRLSEYMEFLYEKDKSEGKINGRSDWKTDSNLRKSIRKRAIALILDFENNRHLLEKQVRETS